MAKPKGKGWFKLGEVGVDSGKLLITDPCYLSNFKNNEAPSRPALLDVETGDRWQYMGWGDQVLPGNKPMPGRYDEPMPGTNKSFNEWRAEGRLVEAPDPEPSREYSYSGCCEMAHCKVGGGELVFEAGHSGQGVVFSSGYGDGVYEVWGRHNDEGRVVEVRVLME